MIDTIALALGHALLAAALLRLALRADVDRDPLLARLSEEAESERRSRKAGARKRRSAPAEAPQAGDGATG